MKKGLDIDRIVGLTGKAMNKTAGLLSNHEEDKDLRMYNKLKPEHFERLSEKFGDRAIESYVKEMESRRMGVK
jgi:hypothetical protein